MPKRTHHWIGLPIVLMGWRVQEHQSKDIQVPHAVDASEKGTIHLDCDTAPLPGLQSPMGKRVKIQSNQ